MKLLWPKKPASVPASFKKKMQVALYPSICLEKVPTQVSVHFSAPADPGSPPLPPPV